MVSDVHDGPPAAALPGYPVLSETGRRVLAGGHGATDTGVQHEVDLAAVQHYADPFLRGIRDVPVLGTPEWCALDNTDRRKLAALAVAALARLAMPDDVHERLQAYEGKLAAVGISEACDWTGIGKTRAEVQRGRKRLATGADARRVDPIATRRWVATGYTQPEGRSAA